MSEIKDVPEDFILGWTRGMNIVLSFIRYESFKLNLFVNESEIDYLDYNKFNNELMTGPYIRDFSPDSFELGCFKDNNLKCISFKFERVLHDIKIGGISIKKVHSEGDVYIERLALTMPKHLAYISPNENLDDSCLIVQKYNFGQTKVLNNKNHIALYLDLSKFNLPPYWKFVAVEMNAPNNTGERFTLVSADIPLPIMFAGSVDLTISTA